MHTPSRRSTGRRYRHVRALERGLRLLVELNRAGSATPAALARASNLDRTTTYRLLATLESMGFVSRNPADESCAPTIAVRQLSDGFTDRDEVSQVAAPELRTLLAKVLWPSDFATFEHGAMVIRETTHPLSALSVHRSMVGRTRPFTRTALGRAVLAAAKPDERDAMLDITEHSGAPDAAEAGDRRRISSIIRDTRERGYAWSVAGADKDMSAIALPVSGPRGVLGAVNIIFFASVMTPEEAARKHLPALRECIAAIERRFGKHMAGEEACATTG
jgi:IclR family transcriptional regulator, mhp operon transcriptional activator